MGCMDKNRSQQVALDQALWLMTFHEVPLLVYHMSICVWTCGVWQCDRYIITRLIYYWLIHKTYQSPTLVAMGTLRQWVGEVWQLVAMVTIFPGADVHAVPSAQLAQPWWLLLRFAVRVQYNAHPQGTYRHTYAEVNKTNSQLLYFPVGDNGACIEY